MAHNPLDGDIANLIRLLRKILSSQPQGHELSKWLGDQPVHLNLCLFAFLPVTGEEFEELEELYDDYLNRAGEPLTPQEGPRLEFRLSPDDLRFLKENGLRF